MPRKSLIVKDDPLLKSLVWLMVVPDMRRTLTRTTARRGSRAGGTNCGSASALRLSCLRSRRLR
jgi:hypothetical protein